VVLSAIISVVNIVHAALWIAQQASADESVSTNEQIRHTAT